jgi:cell division protein FtsQ
MRNKRILTVTAVVFLVLFFVLLLFFLMFQVKTVTVKGSEYYSEEDIKKKVMSEVTDQNTLLFYLRYRFGKGNDVPFIQQIDVEMTDFSSVEIEVYEKRITGCIRNMNEYIYFDKDGTVMEVSQDKLGSIPYFTGLQVKSYGLYETLEVDDDSVFSTILSFSQLIERYDIPADEIHLSSLSGATMYSGKVKILFGKQKMYDAAVAELNNMLPKVLELDQAGVIDMRNFEEGQSTTIFKPET